MGTRDSHDARYVTVSNPRIPHSPFAAVVHEHVHPNIHYVEDQQIHRDTIDEQVNIHYLPVKAEPEFQLHESFVDEDGLTIMTKITRSDQPITLNKQQDRVLVSENMAATPGGSPRVETLYRDRSQLSGGVTPGTYGLPGNVGTNRVDWADDMNEAAACPTAMNALRDGDVFVSGPAPQTKASPHPAATGMGIPPPATQSHQPIHSTDRNDLGPTHHTDIDQRRPDDAYAGLDSEGYLGPGMHPETMREETATNQTAGLAGGIRRPSVTTEWSQVPKPKQAKMKRGEMSPVGERPSRPVPEAKKSLDSFRRKAKELKENVQQNLTRRLSGSKASQVSADATTAAGNVSQAAKDRVASVDTEQIKSGATSVMNNVEQTAQSARQQMPNAPSGNDIATAGARAIAGLKNMAGVTASEHVSTPQPPGAYDSEHYTQSEASDYGMSNHTNTSPSSSPRSQLSVKERELSRDNIEMIKNIDSRPTNQHMEHRVVPAGVIKGGRAILGPSELMLSRAEEEQLAAQKILHGGKMARGGITQGHHAMVAPGTLMLSREEEEKLAAQKLKQQRMAGASIAAKQAMNGQRLQQKMTNGRDTARKVAEEHRRETEREKVQAREIESIINQNVAKDRESTARMEKMKLDAESAKKEADRTQKKKDIQIAKNLKDAYESALAQNQRVLRETYRSGLGVTIGQRGLEADETHHGSCGLHPGDDNYIAKHTIFPTPFDKQDSMTVDDEGTMTEGTHGESASTHRTTSSEQFVSSRPSTLPRQTTENITKHTVFPEGETMVPISQKARTMHEQPSTSVSHHLHKVDESPAPSDSQKVTTTEAISSAIEMPIESMKHELPTTSVSHHMHHATSPSLPSVTTGVASTAVDPVTKGLTKSQKKKLAKKKNKNKNKGAYDFEDTVEKMASEKSQMEAKGGVQGTHNLGVREQHTTQHTKEVNPHNTAMNWSEVAQYGDLEDKVEHGQVKLL